MNFAVKAEVGLNLWNKSIPGLLFSNIIINQQVLSYRFEKNIFPFYNYTSWWNVTLNSDMNVAFASMIHKLISEKILFTVISLLLLSRSVLCNVYEYSDDLF